MKLALALFPVGQFILTDHHSGCQHRRFAGRPIDEEYVPSHAVRAARGRQSET